MIRFSHHSKSEDLLNKSHNMLLDVFAKISQFRLYTFFLAYSALEFHWTAIILIVAHQYGETLTDEDMNAMDWIPKSIL